MKKRLLVDLLVGYADSLIGRESQGIELVRQMAQPYSDDPLLDELLELTDDLAALLVPVRPSPEFIRRLGTSLAAAAAPSELIIGQPSNRKLWIGAILSGSVVSALGVLLLLWRRRGRGSPVVAG